MLTRIFRSMKIVVCLLFLTFSSNIWSQDAKLQKRILSIADKYIDNIVPNIAIRKNIIPDTSIYSGVEQKINSKENFLAKKSVIKSLFSVPYNFLLDKDTIGRVEILVDTLSNTVHTLAMTAFDEHSHEMIKGYSLAMDNKFPFSYKDAKKYAYKNNFNRKPYLFVEIQPQFLSNAKDYYIKLRYFWVLVNDTEKESVMIKLDTKNGEMLEEEYRHKGEVVQMAF